MSMRSRYDALRRSAKYADHLARVRAVANTGRRDARITKLMAARSAVRRGGFGPRGPGGMEFKSIDVGTVSPTAVDTTGAMILLNPCTRGDDIQKRTGYRILMRSIQLKGYNYVTTSTGTDQIHRIMLVLDKQPNGAAFTIPQLLTSTSELGIRNLEYRNRFRVLYDRRLVLNASGESGSRKVWEIYRRFRIPVVFNASTTSTVSDIMENSLYLIVIGSNTAGNTAGSMQYVSRIRFND